MASTTDSSVLVNLNELFAMETDRRVEEAAAKERAKAEEAARAEADRQAREAEIAAARDEERRRADAERERRDAALEDRLRAMRDELAEVRAQREEMRLKVADIATRPAPARRGSWAAGVMAAASLVAAVTATAVAWPRDPQPLATRTPAPIVAVEEAVEAAPLVEPETTPVVEAPVEEPAVVATADEQTPRRVRRLPRVQRDRDQTLSEQLDLGTGRDVLGDDFLRTVEH